jgi:hypothetical protein
MTISIAQLRTLRLLEAGPAHRVYRSGRAGEYTWVHEQATRTLTGPLHRLFSYGCATVRPDNRDVAVITEKGRAVLAAQGSC